MKKPETTPTVNLIGKDGNAFSIIGKVKKALSKAGADKEYVDQYMDEAMAGDYDHLLCVTMDYVNVT